MATDTGFGRVRFFDDFLGDTFNGDNWIVDDITGGTNFAINVQVNGVIRGSAHTGAGQGTLLHGELIWQADDGGPLVFECRFKPETTLDSLYFVGFTDEKTGEMPLDYNGSTFASTASDAVGFYYAGGESSPTWRCGGVAGDVDSTQTAANAKHNPVLSTFQTFRIVVNEDGSASFFIDGDIVVENVAGCVTKGTSVMACFQVCKDATSTGLMDVDYCYVSKGRV